MKALPVLLLCLLIASCATLTEEELYDRLVEANSNVRSYHINSETTMDIKIEFVGDIPPEVLQMQQMFSNMSITSIIEGDFDVETNSGRMLVTVAMQGIDIETEMIIIDGTVYMSMFGFWQKMDLGEEMLQQNDQFQQLLDVLLAGEIERLPDERVDGTDYYVVSIVADPETLAGLLQSMGSDQLNLMDMYAFESYTLQAWVNKDTFIIERSDTDIRLTMDMGELMQEEDYTMIMNADAHSTSRISNINRPVVVELPPEAESAIEMPTASNSLTGMAIAANPEP